MTETKIDYNELFVDDPTIAIYNDIEQFNNHNDVDDYSQYGLTGTYIQKKGDTAVSTFIAEDNGDLFLYNTKSWNCLPLLFKPSPEQIFETINDWEGTLVAPHNKTTKATEAELSEADLSRAFDLPSTMGDLRKHFDEFAYIDYENDDWLDAFETIVFDTAQHLKNELIYALSAEFMSAFHEFKTESIVTEILKMGDEKFIVSYLHTLRGEVPEEILINGQPKTDDYGNKAYNAIKQTHYPQDQFSRIARALFGNYTWKESSRYAYARLADLNNQLHIEKDLYKKRHIIYSVYNLLDEFPQLLK